MGWIGVDLDGTWATYETADFSPSKVGEPIAPMTDRVKRWRAQGIEVRVFTARVCVGHPEAARLITVMIQDWTEAAMGERLPVTCVKDFGMIELWDDRAVSVAANTGVGYRCGELADGPA